MPSLVLLDVLGDGRRRGVVRVARRVLGPDDERLGRLAGPVVVDGDDGAVVDEGVREKVRFELGRGDLMALGGYFGQREMFFPPPPNTL